MSLTKVLVFGATGAQGQPVVRQLLQHGVKVRAVSRDESKPRQMFGDVVESTPADLMNLDQLKRAFDGVDAAFLHLPFIEPDATRIPIYLQNALQAARDTSLPKLVFTTSGPTDERLTRSEVGARNIASQDAILSSRVPSVVLKPTSYLENLLQPSISSDITNNGVLRYPFSASRRISWTSLQDQAEIAIAAMTNNAATGKSFFVASPEAITGTELATILSERLGRTVQYEALTPQQFGDGIAAFAGETIGRQLTDLYEAVEALPPDGMVIDISDVLQVLPVNLTPVSEWVERQNWQ